MMFMFVGGLIDGDLHSVDPIQDHEIRVRVGEVVQVYAIDSESYKEAGHQRGIAHYVRPTESADSLIDLSFDA